MKNKIERKTVSSQVFQELKEMIMDKSFPPNSKLPSENELTQLFGVSRSPIREALSILSASGLVESRQGGGTYVREVSLVNMLDTMTFEAINIEQIYELLEMRTVLETETAAFAAQRATPEDLRKIKSALQVFERDMEDENSVGSEADFLFHHEIVKASHNKFLLQSVENLRELYEKSLHYSLEKNIGLKRKREQIYQEHLKIYESIESRDQEAARYYMKRHLYNVRIKLGDTSIEPLDEKMNS